MSDTEKNQIGQNSQRGFFVSNNINTENIKPKSFLDETLEKIKPIPVKKKVYTLPKKSTPPESLPTTEIGNTTNQNSEPHTQRENTQDKKTESPEKKIDTQEEAITYERVALSRAYEKDLSNAINITEAKTVQKLLREAREKEDDQKTKKRERKARKWYVFGSIIFILTTLGFSTYAFYNYTKLTVPAVEYVSVGVFPTTKKIVTQGKTLSQALEEIDTESLIEGRPYLVELVNENEELIPHRDFFYFIETPVNEPFVASMSVTRLGMIKIGGVLNPFIIGTTEDPNRTLKEFSLIEHNFLNIFQRVFNINTLNIVEETTNSFIGEYRFNVPVRTLYTTTMEGLRNFTLSYGLINENIILITKNPDVIKIVHENITKQ